MVQTWRGVSSLLGGVLLMTPLVTIAGQAAGDNGGGPLVGGLAAGVGLGLLRLAGLRAD